MAQSRNIREIVESNDPGEIGTWVKWLGRAYLARGIYKLVLLAIGIPVVIVFTLLLGWLNAKHARDDYGQSCSIYEHLSNDYLRSIGCPPR